MAQGGKQIYGRPDVQCRGGADTGSNDTQPRRAEVAEDQNPVQEDIGHVHQNDGAHIELGQVDRVPVATKDKVDAHGEQADQTRLKIDRPVVCDRSVLAEYGEQGRREMDQQGRGRQPEQQDEQQPAVQRHSDFTQATGPQPASRGGLHAGCQTNDERTAGKG